MSSYVSVELRRLVEVRADFACEYCLVHVEDTYVGCQVEHIISEKHGGQTESMNLAYACAFCNRSKGTDIGSILFNGGEFTRFFNPRMDRWSEHFVLDGVLILTRTAIGEANAKILRFNNLHRVIEREALARVNRYPLAVVLNRLTEA